MFTAFTLIITWGIRKLIRKREYDIGSISSKGSKALHLEDHYSCSFTDKSTMLLLYGTNISPQIEIYN